MEGVEADGEGASGWVNAQMTLSENLPKTTQDKTKDGRAVT